MAIFPTLGNRVMPSFFANNDQPFNNSNTLLSVGLGLLSGKTAQDQVAQAASNFSNERQNGRAYNRTLQFLRQNNPDLAAAVENGALNPGDAYKEYYRQKLEAQKPKNNFLSAGGSLYDTENGQWITPPSAPGGGEFGLNVIYGTDANGNTVLGQVGKDGSFHQVDTNGFKPVGTTSNLNLGTTYQTRDKAGNVLSSTPIDNVGAATQKAIGTAQGEAAAGIPAAQMTANEISAQIQSLKADPYLSSTVGPIAGRTPNLSADSQRVQSKIAQLQGGAFLAARQMLKGGGQITDYEGQKAEQAVARMNQAQSPEDFKAALDDFNNAVQAGVQKLQAAAAGGQVPPAPAPAAPSPSSTGVVDYTDFFKSGGL